MIFALSLGVPPVAGELEPPAAPAPTVNLAEPRTPVSGLPLVISQPGSFYLTDDLNGVAGQGGITITADDVTLDLNGFSLNGVPGSSNGITVSGQATNVVIRNGTVRNWGGDGIDSTLAQRAVVEDVAVRLNGGEGLFGSVRHTLRRCRFESNGGSGVTVDSESLIEDCTATLNGGAGFALSGPSVIRDCLATNNLAVNISALDQVEVVGCTASLGGAGISVRDRCRVTDCEVSSPNGGNGLSFRDHCLIARNRLDGVSVEITATPGAIRSNSTGCIVEENVVTNSIIGLYLEGSGNIIRGNTVHHNQSNYLLGPDNQIEILLSEIPEFIEWPATVRLTGDLVGRDGADGIAIHSRDVTIDLAGHVLLGVPGAGAGIAHSSNGTGTPVENIVIRNGALRDWPTGGVSLFDVEGVHVEGVTVQGNGAEGINLGEEACVIACTARGNAVSGIFVGAGSVVTDCIAEGNQLDGISVGNGSTVERCTGRFNVEAGILGGNHVTVRGCAGESNRLDNLVLAGGIRPAGTPNDGHGIRVGAGSTVVECSASLNDVIGIRALGGSSVLNCSSRANDGDGFQVTESTLVGCTASENQGDGFTLFSGSGATDCVAGLNSNNGFDAVSGGVRFTDCAARFNGGIGFDVGSDSQITDCRSSTNSGDGIAAGSNCRITDSLCVDNGNGAPVGAGLRVTGRENVIDGNTATSNDLGIVVSNTDNLITRNTATSNPDDNFSIAPGNDFGLIITLTGGGGFPSSEPWANFEL